MRITAILRANFSVVQESTLVEPTTASAAVAASTAVADSTDVAASAAAAASTAETVEPAAETTAAVDTAEPASSAAEPAEDRDSWKASKWRNCKTCGKESNWRQGWCNNCGWRASKQKRKRHREQHREQHRRYALRTERPHHIHGEKRRPAHDETADDDAQRLGGLRFHLEALHLRLDVAPIELEHRLRSVPVALCLVVVVVIVVVVVVEEEEEVVFICSIVLVW